MLSLLAEDRAWEPFTRAIERPDLREDPRFKRRGDRRTNSQALIAILDAVFAERDWEAWRARLDAEGLTFGAIATVADATRDQQMESWLRAHVHAFEHFGGIPALAVPDNTKRIAQELIVNDKVSVLAGFEVPEGEMRAFEAFLEALGVSTRFASYGVSDVDASRMLEAALQGVRGRNFIGVARSASSQPTTEEQAAS